MAFGRVMVMAAVGMVATAAGVEVTAVACVRRGVCTYTAAAVGELWRLQVHIAATRRARSAAAVTIRQRWQWWRGTGDNGGESDKGSDGGTGGGTHTLGGGEDAWMVAVARGQ